MNNSKRRREQAQLLSMASTVGETGEGELSEVSGECVCVYVCMCLYIYIYTCMCMCVFVCTRGCACELRHVRGTVLLIMLVNEPKILVSRTNTQHVHGSVPSSSTV